MPVTLYFADVRVLSDPEVYSRLYSAAPKDRKEKTDRYRFEKDKRLSLGAEALLRRAVRDAGLPDGTEVSYGGNGKPYLSNALNFHFNTAHSGDLVMLAVSDKEIGCDLEEVRPIALRTVRRACTDGEYARISVLSGAERDEAFLRLWVLKESAVKAMGLSLAKTLPRMELRPASPARLLLDGAPADLSFLEGSLPGYRYAVSQAGKAFGASIKTVDLRCKENF